MALKILNCEDPDLVMVIPEYNQPCGVFVYDHEKGAFKIVYQQDRTLTPNEAMELRLKHLDELGGTWKVFGTNRG